MNSFELGFVLAATLLGKQQAEAAERADRVKLPNEEIVCRNATIFEQPDSGKLYSYLKNSTTQEPIAGAFCYNFYYNYAFKIL